MKSKNSMAVSGSNFAGAKGHVGDKLELKVLKGSKRPAYYPAGCIGADLAKRNYVKYLVDRYHKHREADGSFGRKDRFHYAVLFKNIEARFKASTYFIPETRFAELVDYLHDRMDSTILGRVNRKRGIPDYESLDEYVMEHMGSPATE
jgi:hypothetical protein